MDGEPRDGKRRTLKRAFNRHLRDGERLRVSGVIEFYKHKRRWNVRLVEPGEIDVEPKENEHGRS